MRTYNLNIHDANDNMVAFFTQLGEDELMIILRNVVVTSHYFITVQVALK